MPRSCGGWICIGFLPPRQKKMIVKFICAVVTRSLFLLISLIGVWRVVWVKNNALYWFLTILYLPLVVEMILTLKRKKLQDYKWIINESVILTTMCFSGWSYLATLLSSVCANDWILGLHQTLLILLVIGKWLLPVAGGVTRDELSQLLLIFVGTAADILEFTSETLLDVEDSNPSMVYVILGVWTWSMFQFPLHLSLSTSRPDEYSEGDQGVALLARLRTDIWSMEESLFIQDGPFLVVRLTLVLHFHVIHQMLIFFAIKNFLVVVLNFYHLFVIYTDYKASG
ncbi:transmembrane protein 26-like [Salmo salar]|uniref:Transmembrane protein 26-like n=1 Tax=Salmo salar TaxID=8030 RepID=A0ABM3DCK3_SALSA|nr:transmembrane protein 26-like [Salmo salar]|eukprot:XP_014053804.1 PREDICTED: transmembrane protein 26-like [Salmo salar]